MGRVVEELAAWGGGREGGVGEELGEGEAEDGDGLRAGGLNGVFEVALVEDVALAVLDEEDDAGWVAEGGFAVGVESGGQAGGQAVRASVGGKIEGGPRDGFLEERVLGFGEVPWVLSGRLRVIRIQGAILMKQGSLRRQTAK